MLVVARKNNGGEGGRRRLRELDGALHEIALLRVPTNGGLVTKGRGSRTSGWSLSWRALKRAPAVFGSEARAGAGEHRREWACKVRCSHLEEVHVQPLDAALLDDLSVWACGQHEVVAVASPRAPSSASGAHFAAVWIR